MGKFTAVETHCVQSSRGGNYSGTKGGAVRPNEKGGAGYLGYEDKTFTIATAPDQWILAQITQPITNPMNEPAQPAPVGKPIRYLSVCSGMEAASVAWHPLGWTPVGFSEIEPFPCAILKHRFPNTTNHGSLTEYKSWPLEPGTIDLLVGGTPCQSFSVAGLRKGLEDPRGNLALVFLGLADKLKPRWIVWENVPGVLSSAGGRDFGSFLGALVELGYGFAYRVLDAQHFGVPQRRRRVFVVACLGDWRAPAEVLLEPDCVRRDIKKGRAKGKGVAASAEGGAGASGMQTTVGTLCADTHPGAYSGQDAYSGRLIPAIKSMPEKNRFPAVLQPIGVDFRHTRFEKDGTVGTIQSKSIGGYSLNYAPGVAIPYRKSKRACSTTDNETWVEGDTSNTLNNFDLGDTRTTHAIVTCSDVSPTVVSGAPFARTGNERVECEAFIVQASELPLRGQITEKDVCPTLTAGAKQGDTDPLAVQPLAFDGYNQTLSDTSQTMRTGSDCDKMGMVLEPRGVIPTLTAEAKQGDQSPYVCAPTLTASNDPSRSPQSSEVTQQIAAVYQASMAVRRLTPIECERLQGFPDNWSRISWKGKPEDQCPDGPRYKACGNSMAVPVMRWIGERINFIHDKVSR
jgi:DNA (cytosine-5)-methyltransferase 1